MTEMICIVCPKGCHLTVDEDNGYSVAGATCEKGVEYGKAELLAPVRVLTSTVKLTGGNIRRCPVRTNGAIPKDKLFDVMAELNKTVLMAPVKIGQVVIPNILDAGIDIIVTRNIDLNN